MRTKNPTKSRYLIPLIFFLLLIAFAPSVVAVGSPKREQAKIRLTEVKLKVCQTKEKSLIKRMEQLGKLAGNIQENFSAIAERVEEYYTQKVVPNGKTVANYDSLVADIETKKGVVKTALTQAQNNVGNFSCDGEDPKGQLTQFREDMKAVKSALKNYRTSIKNLIVAVRSVTGTTERNGTPSPKPTEIGEENE